MANTHNLFRSFNSTIRLNEDKRKGLIKSRNALRDKIKKYFLDEKPNEIQPKFGGQGSFSMDTAINPIVRYDDGKQLLFYDLDYGIYFIGNEKPTERKTPQSYHTWVMDAVNGHTKSQTDKNTCVRVNFVDGHNLDLPIYYKIGNNSPELAHKVKGWIESDPKEMFEWFNEKAKDNAQLRRIVRFLKAWADFREYSNQSQKMPNGLVFTVLATENFQEAERDDIALKNTLVEIKNKLETLFVCYCPAKPKDEILASRYTQKDYFLKQLNNLIESAEKAIAEENFLKASEFWQKHLGDRFPNGKDEIDEEQKQTNKLLSLTTIATSINEGRAFTDNNGKITTETNYIKNQPHKFYGEN
jgi:hypothetical protein